MSIALVIKGADFAQNALDVVTFDRIHADSISLSEQALSLTEIGATYQLTATTVPSYAEDPIVWRSSDNNVVTVSSNGLIEVVGVGGCTVTAACGNVSASCAVTVIVELSFNKYLRTFAQASNAENRLTYFETLHGTSNISDDKYMECCNGEATNEHLFIAKDMTVLDETTGVYRAKTPEELTSNRVYNYVGYPLPISLPDNCTKIKCICLNDDYAPYALFFQKNVRAYPEGSTTEGRGYPCPNRALTTPIASTELVYQTESEFNVPSGFDSIAVTFITKEGATVFTSLTENQIAQFKIYAE